MKIVVALGGNALQHNHEASAEAQQRVASSTARQLVPLIEAGHKIILVHGNGPQVGNIVLHQEAINTKTTPTLPLDTCVAMSQGSIGFWLQNALARELQKSSRPVPVATVVSQVLVDESDPAFDNPSKPIGPFYSKKQAEELQNKTGNKYREDSGRGWRRVVPSPRPKGLVEQVMLENMLKHPGVLITCGGGGVPVFDKNDSLYNGVEAVIDKDASAAMVADMIDADVLLIATSVDGVSINFNTAKEQLLRNLTIEKAEKYVADNQFGTGSMLPKVLACIDFVRFSPKRRAIITGLSDISEALSGKKGTTIRNK